MSSENSDFKGDPNTTILLELVSKVIENSNSVSGAVMLMSENLEKLAEAVERQENKDDEHIIRVVDLIKEIKESGVLPFFYSVKNWSRRIFRGTVIAIVVPVILLILFLILSVVVKGWPFIVKAGGN